VWPDANPTPSPVDRVTKITGDKPLAVNVRRPLLLTGRPWRESGTINRFGAKAFSLSLRLVRDVAACGHDHEELLRGPPWREGSAGHVDVALAGLAGPAWREGPLPDIPAYLDCRRMQREQGLHPLKWIEARLIGGGLTVDLNRAIRTSAKSGVLTVC
jgi:hypothetical protein